LIYGISTKLAEGYAKYRIIDDPNFETRILLILAIKKVMDKLFFFLGVEPIDKI
jgi:arginyl-tRNA synthetase